VDVCQPVEIKPRQNSVHMAWYTTPTVSASAADIMLGSVNINISTEEMCLGVLLDSALTFAPHVRRLSGTSFYHL